MVGFARVDLDQLAVCAARSPCCGSQGRSHLAQSSNGETRSRRHFGQVVACLAASALVGLLATGTAAKALTLFRYEDQAQRHCPADTVVWLDFKKRKYYLSSQKLYGQGFHGSFVCLQEARRGLYPRSLLGRR